MLQISNRREFIRNVNDVNRISDVKREFQENICINVFTRTRVITFKIQLTWVTEYYYWIAMCRPILDKWFFIWKEYQYLHPVRVARWKNQNIILKKLLER